MAVDLGLNDQIQEIEKEVDEQVTRVFAEYASQNMQLDREPEHVATWISFNIARDYYIGAKMALAAGHPISGAQAVRSGLENLADLSFIYHQPAKKDERCKRYVDSVKGFNVALKRAAGGGLDSIGVTRSMKQANPWTSSTIDDRLKAVGSSLTAGYDLLSYYSHPNPAAIKVLGTPPLKHGLINIYRQANCGNMLFIMAMVLNHSEIKSISFESLSQIGDRLQLKIVP